MTLVLQKSRMPQIQSPKRVAILPLDIFQAIFYATLGFTAILLVDSEAQDACGTFPWRMGVGPRYLINIYGLSL
jgi:hypothetical protein